VSRREDIDNSIWEDEDFDSLSDDAALLYLWSFTNPRCPMAGLYKVKARSICEGRMTPARRDTALEELAKARFVFYIDGWLWVRSRVKHLRTRGQNIATSIIRDLEKVPAGHPIRLAFLTEYIGNSWISGWLAEADLEDPSEGLRTPLEGVQGMGIGTKPLERDNGKSPKAKPDPDKLPEGFDPALAEAVTRCLPILQRTAEARGAKVVTPLAVARAIETYPAKDHAVVAGEVEHWLVHGNGSKRPAKDVVSRFRNFLDGSPDALRIAKSPDAKPSPYEAKVREMAA